MPEHADMEKPKLLSQSNILAVFILVSFTIWLSSWFFERSKYVFVSDARITASMISIGSRIPGWIVNYAVSEGTRVEIGDVLVQIDPRDAQLKLAELEASLHTVQAEYARQKSEFELTKKQIYTNITTSRSRLAAAQSAHSEAGVELKQANRELRRSESLLEQKMISIGDFDSQDAMAERAKESYKRRNVEIDIANSELLLKQSNLAELDVIEKQMEIIRSREAELEVQRDRLKNIVGDHTIRSPINGVVDETFANPGEYVYPGQRIFMLHDPQAIWIKANVKETEIRNVRIGSVVNIEVDAFPDAEVTGTVSNIGNAATSNFALLPSPNPSGNFVKITQRLEVQITIESGKEILKPGMMVELAIQIADEA
ncbi:MAG: HlyD family secretion protein [Pseudomonadales bacterium]|nr:HlyD family secretion protein [Pseudomonadales bacterium]